MLLLTAQEMASLDQKTIREIGIPGIVLMENASRGAADFFLRMIPDLLDRRIIIVAGSGNNAGDGFVLARIFHCRGAQVEVVCLRSPEKLAGDALTNFEILRRLSVPTITWDEAADFEAQFETVSRSGAIVDAMLGTGLNTEVRGLYRRVIERVNGLNIPVLAVDVPSGLDASTGKILGAAFRATATATFGFLKIGHVVNSGPEHCGAVEVIDIGIPVGLAHDAGIRRFWLTADHLRAFVAPRSPAIHKGGAGHACVLSGSVGKTGAAALVSLGAGRAGAGLVTLFIPGSLNGIMEVKLNEAMTIPIAETPEKSPALASLPVLIEFLKGKQSLAMGPGISTHPDTVALVKELLLGASCPMVLDADAITAVSDDPGILRGASAPLVLTPHPGEMARVCSLRVQDVESDRLKVAANFSREYGVVLLLKGYRTVIAAPDGRLAVNSTGNPAMASGGMGDALTGLIAGFIAQGLEPFEAACLGAYVHGEACDRVMASVSTRGLLATDMLKEVPAVIGSLEGF
ncbi:MAG: NAD(P)H-hydrate dehydratase [Desulfobacteraceae bacterium]|nr:NAD(P)H-hydrate dehydratase [Desulfobacteraceae bacterium]